MPNYCDNELSIKGLQKDIVIFLNDFVEKDSSNRDLSFSMNNIIPQPCSCDDKNFNWYDWRVENWGCKWDINQNIEVEDVFDELIQNNDTDGYSEVYIPYTTPWCSNLEFIEKASKKYPNLIFNIKYYEPGCELAGDYTYEDGNETENYCYQGGDSFEYLVWAIENDFESIDFVLGEMELDESDKELYDKLNAYFNPSDEDVIDLSNVLLGNNLPEPQ